MHENPANPLLLDRTALRNLGIKIHNSTLLRLEKKGKISQAAKNWRDQLLASGPRRGIHFEVELGSTTEVHVHHTSSFPEEQCSGRTFLKCIHNAASLAEYTDWISQYYPAREEGQ